MNHCLTPPPRRTGGEARRRFARFVTFALILPMLVSLGMASVGYAGQPRNVAETAGEQPGGTVDSVLVIAKRLSPQLMARALDIDAARARVSVAGSLPDPTLRVTSDELDRMSGPRQNKMIYSVEQDIPLWGKRDLRRQAAEADVSQKAAELKDAEAELSERVKVTFALYYQTWQALRATRELRPILANVAQVARDRYARSLVPQQDVIRSELETTRLENEIARMEGSFKSAQGRLNALLLRPLDAPLAPPRALRPLPPPDRFEVVQLVDRARSGNPSLAANKAMVRAGERNADLARRGWYPDVTLSLGAIDRTGNGPNGYVASIGVKVPLQWGLHEGQVRDAVAQTSAARARQDVAEQQIQGDLAEAAAALEAGRRAAALSVRRLIPLAQTMLRSATADYAVGKIDLAGVLQAERDVTAVRIELLSTELDQQRQLAAIERLIGGDL
jgi:cobalt-zinc-cadmium efflux system outer membrane protein